LRFERCDVMPDWMVHNKSYDRITGALGRSLRQFLLPRKWHLRYTAMHIIMPGAVRAARRTVGQTIELVLDAIAHGGEAIGRHAGKTVFVPYAMPGERVRAELVEEKERWARARLVAVLQPSPDRVDPPCPYFGPDKCGGCQWQHIAYERQAELKHEILADQLRRLGHIARPNIADIIAVADPEAGEGEAPYLDYGYLNRIDFGIAGGRTALPRTDGRSLIPVDFCLLVNERIDQLHGALQVDYPELTGIRIRASENTDDALVLFETTAEAPEIEIDLPAAVALRGERGVQPLIGEAFLTEDLRAVTYRISALSYFPPNTAGAAALVDVVLAYAGVQPGEVVLDLYCSVGLFSIPLADAGARVTGVESNAAACEDFAANAGERGNIELHEGAVEEVLPALLAGEQHVDVVVLDPPHAGAGPDVLRMIADLGPRRLVYIASDPATLARDAVYLFNLGYRLVEAQPIDLQPQTFRVETVALWER
jgi:23S rRNA (uracil1939-C5)-methyltransferase